MATRTKEELDAAYSAQQSVQQPVQQPVQQSTTRTKEELDAAYLLQSGTPVQQPTEEASTESGKETTFARGFVESNSFTQNLSDIWIAGTGEDSGQAMSGQFRWEDDDGNFDLNIKTKDDLYGDDFADLTFDERRVRINEVRAAEIERLYPNQEGSTFGRVVGSLFDPTTLLPVGATYTAMMKIAGALGFSWSAADQFQKKGEVDVVEAGGHAIISGIAAPVLGYGIVKTGQVITKARLPKQIEKSNKALDDYENQISHEIATAQGGYSNITVAQAKANAQDHLKLTPEQIANAEKLTNRRTVVPKKAEAIAIQVAHKDANMLSHYVESMSSRIGTLSKPIQNVLRKYESRVLSQTQARMDQSQPFIKAMGAYSNKAKDEIKYHLLNGDFKAAKSLMNKGGIKELDDLSKMLYKDGKRMEVFTNANRGKGVAKFKALDNYFPRRVKDYDGLRLAIGGKSQAAGTALDDAINAAMTQEGVKTVQELSEMALTTAVMKATNTGWRKGIAPKGSEGKRTLQEVPPELAKFYDDSISSLTTYVQQSTKMFERQSLLGKTDLLPVGQYDESSNLWKLMGKEVSENRLSGEAHRELKELLHSRFTNAEKAMNKTLAAIKDIGYMSSLGQFRSAITQLKDVGTSAYLHGVIPTIRAVFKTKSTYVQDAGLINNVSAEMTQTGTRKWLDRTLKYSGFRFSDRFGKKVLLEASMLSGKRLASSPKGIAKLKKKYGEAYGNDFTKLINSLRNGTDDANTELYRFHELSDTQPISMLELPQGFADNPDIGRLAYALKSFGLKQVTLIHNNIIKRAKGGDKLGATKEALKYASFIGIAGGTVDELKGVFSGEAFNAEDIPDRVIENLTSLMFINKYSIGDIKKGDMSGWIGDVVTPPLGPLEAGIKEVSGFTEERDINDPSFGDDLLKTMPVMGRILYDWYLGGREKAMDKRSDEQQADLRGE